ncbi:MAG: hypothetical protein JW893_04510 [Candidatus Omnitrophica bacterium]|nr:hypothetical protein [Candidatus Omnitrophota bacterium]
MPWESLRNQDFAVRVLRAHLEAKRIAPTYLLSGKHSSDKEALAEAFASALNCERGQFFSECSCLQCHKVQSGNHPDVLWIGWDLKERSIKIEEMRQLVSGASLKPYEGKWKVFILCGAERLTTDAANSLLKSLEEPPPNSVFLLLVESKSHLMETIQSRVFEIRLKPCDSKTEFEKSYPQEWQSEDWIDILEAYQKTPREELKDVLDQLMSYYREKIHQGINSSQLSHQHLEACLDAIDKIRETKDAVAANVNQKLALTRLTIHLRNRLKEKVAP